MSVFIEYLVTIPVAGAVTAAPGVLRYTVPADGDIVSVSLAVDTAPTGAALIADVNVNGVSIFADAARPTVAAGTNAVTVKAPVPVAPGANIITATVPDGTSLGKVSAGQYLTLDVDQVGSTVAGSNLVAVVRIVKR